MYKLAALALILSSQAVWAENNQAITTGSRFNPQISLILDGNFYHDNQKGKSGELLDNAAGIGHGVGLAKKQVYKTALT